MTPEKVFLARVCVEHYIATNDQAKLEVSLHVVTLLAFHRELFGYWYRNPSSCVRVGAIGISVNRVPGASGSGSPSTNNDIRGRNTPNTVSALDSLPYRARDRPPQDSLGPVASLAPPKRRRTVTRTRSSEIMPANTSLASPTHNSV
jgi:hypothetical protein